MNKQHRRAAAAALAAGIASLTSAPSALAGLDVACEAVVQDAPNLIDDTRVAAAVARVAASTDSAIRVIVTDIDPGDPDDWFAEQVTHCPAWQQSGDPEALAPRMLAIVVHPEVRTTSIKYGAEFKPRLDPVESNIQTSKINPKFADGDFTGGVLAGLTAIENRLTSEPPTPATTLAPAPSQADTPGAANQPQRTTANDRRRPGRAFALTFTAVVAVAGAGIGTSAAVSRARRRRARRADLLERCGAAREQIAASVLSDAARRAELTVAVNAACDAVDVDTARTIIETLTAWSASADAVVAELDLSEPPTKLDDLDRHTISIERTAGKVSQVDALAERMLQRAEHLIALAASLDDRSRRAASAAADAGAAVENAAAQGWHTTEFESAAVLLGSALAEAAAHAGARRAEKAVSGFDEVTDSAQRLIATVGRLDAEHEAVSARLATTQDALDKVADDVSAGHAAANQLTQERDKKVYAAQLGDGPQAWDAMTGAAVELAADARARFDARDPYAATRLLDSFHQAVTEVRRAARRVVERRDDLANADRELAATVAAAGQALGNADAYVGAHHVDLPSKYAKQLAAERQKLDAAAATGSRGDSVAACQAAASVADAAEEVLASAKRKIAAQEAELERAARAAEAAVRSAGLHIYSGSRHSELSRLRSQLSGIDAGGSLADREKRARKVADAAKKLETAELAAKAAARRASTGGSSTSWGSPGGGSSTSWKPSSSRSSSKIGGSSSKW